MGQLFENHVDAVGLSINQPSRTAAVGSSLAPHGQRGPQGGYGEAEAEAAHGAKWLGQLDGRDGIEHTH